MSAAGRNPGTDGDVIDLLDTVAELREQLAQAEAMVTNLTPTDLEEAEAIEREGKNQQQAPWPTDLEDLVGRCAVDPGWLVELRDVDRGQGSKGLTLCIRTLGFDAYHPDRGRGYRVMHYFPVPPAAYDRENWQRWLFERYRDVVSHEACEFFTIDGKRPYAPHHGDGSDPYIVWARGTDADARRRPGL